MTPADRRPDRPIDISIILVNYHSRVYLENCLDHLARCHFAGEREILLVNNSPGDGTDRLIAERFPDVSLIDSDRNLGFGPACNLAFKQARGEFILLVNPDANVSPDALQSSIDYFRAHPRTAVVGAQLCSVEGAWQPSARCFPSVLDKFFMLTGLAAKFPKSRLLGRVDMTWWDHSHPKAVDWVVGAFFMVRARVAEELAWFDPRFFLYFEELDLCRRVRAKGWEVHYLPHVKVHHVGGASSAGMDGAAVDGAQITMFRLFAEALYYGKYYGWIGPWVMLGLESWWSRLRWLKNRLARNPEATKKAGAIQYHIRRIRLALRETRYGRRIPAHPWQPDPRAYAYWKETG